MSLKSDNMLLEAIAEAADNMTAITELILHAWLVEEDKEKAFGYYKTLSPYGKQLFMSAMKDMVSQFNHEQFRQAAKDIPEYFKSR